MKKRTHSIGKAAIIRCLSVAAILTVAVFSGCTPDSPENPENPREELDEGNIKINVSGGGELGDYTTKAAASREARYTVTGRVISGNGAGIEDETFEVVVTPNEGPTGFMPATRASYGAVQVDGTKKTATIRWDEGDRVSVFSDVGKHDNTYAHPGTGNVNNIAYCNYDIKEEQTAEGYTATATPVAAAPFNGSGLKWDKGKAHRFIGIWPPVDTIATLADAKIEADRLELSFNVKQPSKQTAKLDANISNESVYRPDLGSVMMYSGLSVAADKAVESTDVDLLFRPAFTSLEFALLKQNDNKTMTLQYVTVSSQENFLACQSDQKFTGVISQDANASGNNGTTFTIDATSLSQTGSKSIDLTFLDANGKVTPELDVTKPTKFCILALPHQIGTLTIFLGLKVGGEEVVRQLDLRVNENGFKKWIEIPACSKVIISNLRIPTSVTKGLVQKAFSVAPNKTVYFSPGNLQVKLQGDRTPTTAQWRFAPNQYDIIAETGSNTDVTSGTGWIDLFGWSGLNNRRPAPSTVYGLRTSTNNNYYKGPFNNWGVNSAVTTSVGYGWNLLTKDEMNYLLNERTGASSKVALATVGEVEGIVILPDEWSLPSNCTFESAPLSSGNYTTNKYSTAGFPGTSGSWTAMEKEGAVFFPNTGIVDNNGTYTSYSTIYQTSSLSYQLGADPRPVNEYYSWGSDGFQVRAAVLGVPVRLSKSTEATADNTPINYSGEGVTPASNLFAVSQYVKVQFTTSNLMWEGNGSKGRFRLMDKPWTILDNEKAGTVLPDNRTVSENIGMFKWGTGGGNNIWPWTTETDLTKYVTNWSTWEDWNKDRVFRRYWDWGDNVVYDMNDVQMCAEKGNSRLRTLTKAEWDYLMFDRTVSYARYAIVRLKTEGEGGAAVEGMIIFPDNYSHPASAPVFTARQLNQDPVNVDFTTSANTGRSTYREIKESHWQEMANNGAAFLPCAGLTDKTLMGNNEIICASGGTSTTSGGAPGCYYWTSTCVLGNRTRAVLFSSSALSTRIYGDQPKSDYMAVRLVYESDYETRSWDNP